MIKIVRTVRTKSTVPVPTVQTVNFNAPTDVAYRKTGNATARTIVATIPTNWTALRTSQLSVRRTTSFSAKAVQSRAFRVLGSATVNRIVGKSPLNSAFTGFNGFLV